MPLIPPPPPLPLPHVQYNKGLAFSKLERDRLYLRGLLPPAVLSQEVQAERVMTNIRRCTRPLPALILECCLNRCLCRSPFSHIKTGCCLPATATACCCSKVSDVEKHTYFMSLQERNERLFYYVLSQVWVDVGVGAAGAMGAGGCGCYYVLSQVWVDGLLVGCGAVGAAGAAGACVAAGAVGLCAAAPAPVPALTRSARAHLATTILPRPRPSNPSAPPGPCSTLRSCCPCCPSPPSGTTAAGTASCSAGEGGGGGGGQVHLQGLRCLVHGVQAVTN